MFSEYLFKSFSCKIFVLSNYTSFVWLNLVGNLKFTQAIILLLHYVIYGVLAKLHKMYCIRNFQNYLHIKFQNCFRYYLYENTRSFDKLICLDFDWKYDMSRNIFNNKRLLTLKKYSKWERDWDVINVRKVKLLSF